MLANLTVRLFAPECVCILVAVDEIEEFQSRSILQRRLTVSIQRSHHFIALYRSVNAPDVLRVVP